MALKGAFEGGGDPAEIDLSDPKQKELEDLFDRLNKTPQERKMMRDSYLSRGAIDELLAHLRGRLEPAVNGEVKRGPGRPKKIRRLLRKRRQHLQ